MNDKKNKELKALEKRLSNLEYDLVHKIEDLQNSNDWLILTTVLLGILTFTFIGVFHILPRLTVWFMTLNPIDTAYFSGMVIAFMIWLAIKLLLWVNSGFNE